MASFSIRQNAPHALAEFANRQGASSVIFCELPADASSPSVILREIQQRHPGARVVFLIPDYTLERALELREAGAFEVLAAGISDEELAIVEHLASESLPSTTHEPVASSWSSKLIGRCSAMQDLVRSIATIAERRSTVLITGETGTGKEIVARAIHEASGRKGKLVTLNCTALPETLLEAELFGHTRGAFTGAQSSRIGRFEAAHKGTIFLDEIGDMPLDLQAKLLRVLQEREVQRLGSSESIAVDVRVVAATNAELLTLVEDGRFREDLYYRLNVVPLHLPPLREREGDIRPLAFHFAEKICRLEGIPGKILTPAVLARLETHAWPGNVRELENTIERAIALSGDRREILPRDLLLGPTREARRESASPPIAFQIPEGPIDFERIVASVERRMIEHALNRTNGNKSQAADLLGLKRTTLGAKLRHLAATA
jgi:DNA-binding NtrC family response regulator